MLSGVDATVGDRILCARAIIVKNHKVKKMNLFVYYSTTSLFITSNRLPTRSNKLGVSSGHISYTVPYLFYSNLVLFLLESLLYFLL
jgi:hypothetical protein